MVTETEVLARARDRRIVRSTPTLLRSLRVEAGLTMSDVGRILGVSHVAVSRWETGARVPRGDMAHRYLSLLRRAMKDER